MKTDKIFFGAAYYDEYMPTDRIDEDMRLMSEAGMNIIRIAESTWSTLEPHDGVFDFTSLERMLSAAERYEISVIVGTPTYAIPTWLVKKYPDILAVTHSGLGLYGHRQNMDITHKGYLFHCERVIRKLMEYVANRPCVIGYQIDNETKSYDTCCDNVQKTFVEYLKNQYTDINEFNKEFGLDYWSNRVNSWDDFPDIRGTINQSLDAEFRKFQRKLVTDFINWQLDIIDEYRRDNQFVTHNFDYDWIGTSYGVQPEVNQYDTAKRLTVAGTDIYHPGASALTGAEIAFGGALMRSLKGQSNYLVLETQAQGNPNQLPYVGQLRLQAFSHIASGANSVMYWHWHSIHNAIESYWKGVLSHNLTPGKVYYEAAIIGQEFARIGSLINNLEKKSQAAIMVNNESLTGLLEFPLNENLSYNKVLRWIHDALYRLNIECDFIPQDTNLEKLSAYKIIFTPAMYSVTEDVTLRLKKYVHNGGCLVSTFRSFFADEHIKIYHDAAPHNMTDCFGMSYDRFTTNDNMTFNGNQVKYFMEFLDTDGGNAFAMYDNENYGRCAAITDNRYGKGRAVYIGCYFDDRILERLLKEICMESGVNAPTFSFPLIRKAGVNSYGKEIIFYFNYSDKEICFNGETDGTELLTGSAIWADTPVTLKPWGVVIEEVL